MRTREGLPPQHAFQACALNRSATPPNRDQREASFLTNLPGECKPSIPGFFRV